VSGSCVSNDRPVEEIHVQEIETVTLSLVGVCCLVVVRMNPLAKSPQSATASTFHGNCPRGDATKL
jgi:hypothetical protein